MNACKIINNMLERDLARQRIIDFYDKIKSLKKWTEKKCGHCEKWMTKSCGKEYEDGSGYSKGPSCGHPAPSYCFVINEWYPRMQKQEIEEIKEKFNDILQIEKFKEKLKELV
jgi:hypothetical protein